MVALHLHHQKSIPAFLSAVTLDLFSRQTTAWTNLDFITTIVIQLLSLLRSELLVRVCTSVLIQMTRTGALCVVVETRRVFGWGTVCLHTAAKGTCRCVSLQQGWHLDSLLLCLHISSLCLTLKASLKHETNPNESNPFAFSTCGGSCLFFLLLSWDIWTFEVSLSYRSLCLTAEAGNHLKWEPVVSPCHYIHALETREEISCLLCSILCWPLALGCSVCYVKAKHRKIPQRCI